MTDELIGPNRCQDCGGSYGNHEASCPVLLERKAKAKSGRSYRVGMPATLWLHEFGSQVWAAFGSPPYLVGSALQGDREPHDVDVRLILSDEEYEAWGLGDPRNPHLNAKWVSLVLAYSTLGRHITGLPIDFQIQARSLANKQYDGPRSAIGLIALRMAE